MSATIRGTINYTNFEDEIISQPFKMTIKESEVIDWCKSSRPFHTQITNLKIDLKKNVSISFDNIDGKVIFFKSDFDFIPSSCFKLLTRENITVKYLIKMNQKNSTTINISLTKSMIELYKNKVIEELESQIEDICLKIDRVRLF